MSAFGGKADMGQSCYALELILFSAARLCVNASDIVRSTI